MHNCTLERGCVSQLIKGSPASSNSNQDVLLFPVLPTDRKVVTSVTNRIFLFLATYSLVIVLHFDINITKIIV